MRNIVIRNFKSLVDATIPLGELTLLAGLNGAGKSSVIQALLSLRQSFTLGQLGLGNLVVDGPIIDLGSPREVLSETAKEDEITIGFQFDGNPGPAFFSFQVIDGEPVARAIELGANIEALTRLREAPFGRAFLEGEVQDGGTGLGFHYLQAERVGPRKFSAMAGSGERGLLLGSKGEFALQVLHENQDLVLLEKDDPRRSSDVARTLRAEVERWLHEVSPGVRFDLLAVDAADLIVGTLSFGSEGELRSRAFRTTNVGFGLTYVLPVLMALLTASPGGIVVIENPEAHLHPRGQTRLGELCARASAAGVKVLVETHSDHFMDGARIAVREKVLSASQVTFHYFSREGSVTTIKSPKIDDQGRLSEWPQGFFDQHRRNASRLIVPIDAK